MAIAKVKKIQLIGLVQQKDKILEILQSMGSLDVKEITNLKDEMIPSQYKSIHDFQKTELDYANTEYAIKLLSKYGEKKKLFAPPLMHTVEDIKEKAEKFNFKEIVDKCVETEDQMVKAKNKIATIKNELIQLNPWEKLSINLQEIDDTQNTKTLIGAVKTAFFQNTIQEIHKLSNLISSEVVNSNKIETYILLIFSKELEKDIRKILQENKFIEADLPKENMTVRDVIHSLKNEEKINNEIVHNMEKELKSLAKNLDNLKITNEHFGWIKEKLETEKKSLNTSHSFAVNAWIEEENVKHLEENILKETKHYSIAEIQPNENEEPPVIIKNRNFVAPFETVTKIFGLPKYNEVDPTPLLASFFVIYFALCLSDGGYGVVMTIILLIALKKMHFDEGMKKMVTLLIYGGVLTVIVGALFGGWFGMSPDQVPSFFTYTTDSGEKMFLLQRINPLTNPIAVLIIAAAFGFFQATMGTTVKLIHDFRTGDKLKAILDTGTWVYMLLGIAVSILAMAKVLPDIFATIGKWWVISAAIILIATQGREKKGILAKLFSGILSLYNLVGYMSDILSYSRLLALGLATSIIALAVNTIGVLLKDMIPVLGWVLMIAVFIGGHIFNLLINALGAFIHSGRLQFVEFFGKFMEGGGAEFKPFDRKTKYVFIKK
jgi:V/A-type H+/Na+-transporting ATPase subunit I